MISNDPVWDAAATRKPSQINSARVVFVHRRFSILDLCDSGDCWMMPVDMYRAYLTDQKSKNSFVKTVAPSRAQEDILKAVSPHLLPKCTL